MAHRRFRVCLLLTLGLLLVNSAASHEPVQDANSVRTAVFDHWSFKPFARPDVPHVKNGQWIRNPIDQFILARLEREGIVPSPEADRVTLVRRLSLDLLGLLPIPAEVDAFVEDKRADAYERLVERLLDSPHFGERWGRHWLDLARYADSDGYEKDSPRPFAYLYRDWVIDAFNRDLPFDQFTEQQLAGDLLPGAALEHKIATGFHRNTLTNKEGGVDPEEFRTKANVDRVSTTATVWLGLTLACAECHNHKYDPLTQRDFYSFFSFFNRSMESEVSAPQPAEIAAYDAAKQAYDAEYSRLTAALAQFERDQLPARFAEWETSLAGNVPSARWVTLEPIGAASAGGATLTQQPDGSLQAAGKSPTADTYTIEVRTNLTDITAFRLEVLPDPNHPAKGPGRVSHGNFVLNEFTLKAAEPGASGTRAVGLQNAIADFSQDRYAVAGAIDGNIGTGWAIAPRFGERHVAVFETKENLVATEQRNSDSPLTNHQSPLTLFITLDQQFGAEHTIGRLRLSATTEPRPVPAEDIPSEAIAALRVPPEQRSEEQARELAKYYRSIDAEWQRLNAAVAAHAKKAPPPPATKAMTLASNPKPPDTHLLIRGDFLRKGDPVEPGMPDVLESVVPFEPRGDRPDRLDLARWLVDPANPLTARVAVNRMWQYLFGKGLVATPNDFGTRGEPPSHPGLLDWLACEFVGPSQETNNDAGRRDWRHKQLIKLIVGSATYRQSSSFRPDLAERDPSNTTLARQNRYRLEAEIVRDLHLAASGLLAIKVGGPSVRPPQPAGIAEITYAGSAKWVESAGPDRYRRGMYTWFQRTSPYPMLMTFDSPDGVVCMVRRERSNTPLQALTLLNDTVFFECAQGLARRTLGSAPSPEPSERARNMFRLCMTRDPTTSELARLLQLNAELTVACHAQPELAQRLAAGMKLDGVDPIEIAAWVAQARTILNLDEFVTRE
jgi:hypothetical protein